RATYWPNESYYWHERLLYVGLVPLVAATLVRGRWRWACWGCAAVAVALSFGSYAPWYAWAVKLLPGYGSFRNPPKHLVLAALAFALAAGLGIERLRGRKIAFSLTALAAGADIASLTFAQSFPVAAALLGGMATPAVPSVQDSLSTLAKPGLVAANTILLLAAVAALLPKRWATRAQV